MDGWRTNESSEGFTGSGSLRRVLRQRALAWVTAKARARGNAAHCRASRSLRFSSHLGSRRNSQQVSTEARNPVPRLEGTRQGPAGAVKGRLRRARASLPLTAPKGPGTSCRAPSRRRSAWDAILKERGPRQVPPIKVVMMSFSLQPVQRIWNSRSALLMYTRLKVTRRL